MTIPSAKTESIGLTGQFFELKHQDWQLTIPPGR